MSQQSSQRETQTSETICQHQGDGLWAGGCCKELKAKEDSEQPDRAPHQSGVEPQRLDTGKSH